MTSPSSPVDIIEPAMEGVTPGTWVAGYSSPMRRTRYVYANGVSILEKRLRAAMGAEGQQFMQALVDEASAEIQKRKAAEAELTRLRSECVDGLDALSDIDDFWEASPYPGNRKHLTPAEQISSLVCELNAAHDQVAALKSKDIGNEA